MHALHKWDSIGEEYADADLGDKRRSDRLVTIAEALHREPSKGFPRALGSTAELEAFYRFVNNDGFSAADILEPHIEATVARVARAQAVVAIHDTTIFQYSKGRQDLGITNANHYGFAGHMALLVSAGDGLPLGVGYAETVRRTGEKWAKRNREGQRGRVHADDETRESLRWLRGIQSIQGQFAQQADIVHVTDAEGDFFELLSSMNSDAVRFVVRVGQQERNVIAGQVEWSLREVADKVAQQTTRMVTLSERKHPPRTNITKRLRHPDRRARVAKLAIGSTTIALKPTRYSEVKSEAFKVNLVRVWEKRAPKGEPKVEWLLLTTEDVSTNDALLRIVDIYRMRWTIEEYFKALKSGCALERRQLESYEALCKVLALFIPIAYRLLLLRGIERATPAKKASAVLSPTELRILTSVPSNRELGSPKTVGDVLLHIARLGGHIKNNGAPGWQTLAWGYEKLLMLRLGWELAVAEKCDQS